MDPVHAQREGSVNMFFQVVDEKDLSGFDGGPRDGRLEDLDGRFFKSHLIGQNPFIEGPHHGEF